jgi:two-component system, cell cycle response regulator
MGVPRHARIEPKEPPLKTENAVDGAGAQREIQELKSRLSALSADAEHNQHLLRRTQERELLLLRADSLAALLRAMVEGLRDSFALDATSVALLDPQHEIRHLLVAGGERPDEFKHVFFVDSLIGLAPQFAALHKPWLGAYVGADHHLLFSGAVDLKSVALIPLPRKDRTTGALCFGSRDATRFTRHHGSDFLAHLGVLAAVCVENAINRTRLLRAGITDFLTGWHNRRYLQQRLKEELARAQRRSGSVACLMMDIDRFKSINDGYGHLIGDNVLKEIAHRVELQIRSMDTAARFGGDELAILLPDAGAADAARLAERIREAICAVPIALGSEISKTLTISVGVAALAPSRNDTDLKALADKLVADADAALYRAKALGRNRVQVGTG